MEFFVVKLSVLAHYCIILGSSLSGPNARAATTGRSRVATTGLATVGPIKPKQL